MVLEHLGVSSVGHTALCDALRSVLRSWVWTTATVGQKSKFGLSGAWDYSSYSYWFRNYGGTGGVCGRGSYFKEL